ncbi:MAG: N-acetylglucosamine-6-phosphate deacetylase [Nocardioidaceae bacterium]
MNTLVLKSARVVTPDSISEDGWVEVRDEKIHAVGTGPRPDGVDLGGRLLTPGFVDIHVHGGAGVAFQDASPNAARAAAEFHLQHGTTTLLAGLGTRPLDDLIASTELLMPLVEEGVVAGIFYEGPFLSNARRGAHNPRLLRTPDLDEMARLLAPGKDVVRMVTIAPELPGALDLIHSVVDAGVTAAVGHTDASYDECCAAFEGGATVATHLFNGMRPIHHRDPGPVLAALGDDRVTCEVIADGFHLDDAVIKHVFDAVGHARSALITDAIEAAGAGDGAYDHGDMHITVKDGMAMLSDGSSIAGSTLTMDKALRRSVLSAGVPLHDALLAATATPARAIGLADQVGVIAPGNRADLLVMDDSLTLNGVLRRGDWITELSG